MFSSNRRLVICRLIIIMLTEETGDCRAEVIQTHFLSLTLFGMVRILISVQFPDVLTGASQYLKLFKP